MSSFKYLIRGSKRDTVPVYFRFSHGSFDCKLPSGLHVSPKHWDQKRQTLKTRIPNKADLDFLEKLNGLKSFIEKENRTYTGQRNKDWLISLIGRYYNIKEDTENTLSGFISSFIARIESGDLKNKRSSDFVPGTVRKLKGFQRIFNQFQGIYTEKDRTALLKENKPLRPLKTVDFEDIDNTLYNSFVAWLSNEGYKVNTIGRFVKELKYFMHKALVEKKHTNREFEEFEVSTEESHAIYLTTDEVQKIYEAKITDPRVEVARDCFIVLCETALRISDYRRIDVSLNGNFININNWKTGIKVIIPLTRRMQAILKKYSGKLPYIPDQYVNEYIKNVAFQVGLKDVVSWVTTKNGKKETVFAQKWKLITCHTGRRTACTNMYKAGIPVLDIMKISGHKTEKSFLKYIRISQEETAQRLADHPYFKMKVV